MSKQLLLIMTVFLLACTEEQIFEPVQGSSGSAISAELQHELFLKTKTNPKQLMVSGWTEKDGDTTEELKGVVFAGLYEEKARSIMDADSKRVKAQGYKLYLTNLHFDEKIKPKWDLAVVKGYSDLDLLKKYGVSGPNYDITNEQVVDQINKWLKHMKLDFVSFEQDRFEAKIISTKYEMKLLAEENYKLCPDVIDQGYESMEELIKALSKDRYLWCWWD